MKHVILMCSLFIFMSAKSQTLTNNIKQGFEQDNPELILTELKAQKLNIDDCFTVNGTPYSLLIIAIKMNKEKTFKELIKQKANLNKICADKSPLMYTAKYGKAAMAKQLIEAGANPALKNSDGDDALNYAKKYEHKEIENYLSSLHYTPSKADSATLPAEKKISSIASDGPIIIYENEKIISHQIIPANGKFSVATSEIKKADSLTCYVDETKDQFSFVLKNELTIEPNQYPLPDKMLILSDIEGNFRGFKMILQGNKIIDKNFNWTFGNNHLVLVGDFFDRGVNVTECLWLIYKLETEAEKQGGKVHFILGNHDVMNLKGDVRYVHIKYKSNADTMQLNYMHWYAQNSELGKWLRTKNGVEKIGDYLFVHAGISKNFPKQYSLTEINDGLRKAIDKNFEDGQQRNDFFVGSESPIWYRGIAKQTESQEDVDKTINNYKASKMIIGHTILGDIQYLYNDKVIAIDLEHQSNSEQGKMHALWCDSNGFSITNQNGTKKLLK